ncbi:hypothetical protein [Kiloniella majae]|uniref:hypothetical protein n=1 Tax=Kiloniella majae TaxID=1938558 RepID=UPI000A276FBF|nr:hypothetical protein [Kiloniella majae]
MAKGVFVHRADSKMDTFRKQLAEIPLTNANKYLEDIAFELEMESLGFSIMPDDIFALHVELFEDVFFFHKKGAYNFIVGLYSKVDKLSESQKNQLLEIFVINFSQYDGYDFRLWICSFIAKCYSSETTISVFEDFANKYEFKIIADVLVALDTIIYQLKKEGKETERAELLYKKILLKDA